MLSKRVREDDASSGQHAYMMHDLCYAHTDIYIHVFLFYYLIFILFENFNSNLFSLRFPLYISKIISFEVSH